MGWWLIISRRLHGFRISTRLPIIWWKGWLRLKSYEFFFALSIYVWSTVKDQQNLHYKPWCILSIHTNEVGRLLSKLLAMYAQKGILLTVSAMIGKAVSGSQRRQFVVSIATSHAAGHTVTGRGGQAEARIKNCHQPKLIRWVTW